MKSLGAFLKSKREERGLALEEMSEKTRIPLRYLSAIEEDRLDQLPGKVYERLFIRTYSDVVGVNVDELAREFREIQNTLELKVHPEDETRSPMLKRGIWALVILAVFLVVILLLTRKEGKEPAERPEASEIVPNLVPVPASDTPAVQAAVQKEPEGLKLELEATEENWVRLSADNRTIFEGVLGAGEKKSIEAENKIKLSLGRAWAVNATLNGRRLKKLAKEGTTLLNFELNRGNYPALIDSAVSP
jgi:transcriptional regulator with XRE-family HTH domain